MAERAHPDDPGFRDRWFGLRQNPYRRRLIERYRSCDELIRGKELLDVPCGTGWGTSMLRGYRRALGLDISGEAIAYARRRYERPGELEFRIGDMARLGLAEASLDVVLCLEGFEHVERHTGLAFLAEARRVLRRGGTLVLTCPVLNERGEDTGNPHHLCEYPEEELVALLNERFRIRRLDRFAGPDGPEYRAVLESFGERRYDRAGAPE